MVGIVTIREFRAGTLNGRIFGNNCAAAIDVSVLAITAINALACVVPCNRVIDI